MILPRYLCLPAASAPGGALVLELALVYTLQEILPVQVSRAVFSDLRAAELIARDIAAELLAGTIHRERNYLQNLSQAEFIAEEIAAEFIAGE